MLAVRRLCQPHVQCSRAVSSACGMAARPPASAWHTTGTGLTIAMTDTVVGGPAVGPVATAVLFCHATGFCKEVWRPVVQELEALCTERRQSVVLACMDVSGHGDSYPRGDTTDPTEWGEFLVSDVGEALEQLRGKYDGITELHGVGHSMGAAGLMLADLAGLGPFQSIVAFEPIMWPPQVRELVEGLPNALAVMAAKRRHLFPSPAHAKDYFLSKRLFQTWDPRAVDAYVDGGIMATHGRYPVLPSEAAKYPPESRRVCLKCAPAFESGVFRGFHAAWEHLGDVHARTLVLAGQATKVFAAVTPDSVDVFRMMADLMPGGRMLVMDGCSHFGPMERPKMLAALVAQHSGIAAATPPPKL